MYAYTVVHFGRKAAEIANCVKFGVVQYILGPLSHVVSVLLGEGGRPLRKLSKVQKLIKITSCSSAVFRPADQTEI